MKLRHVDEVMMARRAQSLSKFMEARFNERGCDDWIKEGLIGCYVIWSILFLIGLVAYFA